jgi:hypothetical protein
VAAAIALIVPCPSTGSSRMEAPPRVGEADADQTSDRPSERSSEPQAPASRAAHAVS